jgi:serine/threonine protein phosphatase 1
MARTLIIGDIHGCYDELRRLLDAAAVADDDVIVSVGDLVDRGPEPTEVVRWFRERPGAIVLMGNHERKHVRRVYSYSQEVTRLQMGDAYDDAVAWMAKLPYFYETDDVRVVHAALVPGMPLAEQDEQVLAGTTAGEAKLRARFAEGFWHERYTDDKPVVFGHHVTGPEPLLRDGRVFGIDTGACHGHRLTAVSVPDFRVYQVDARPDRWKATARAYQVPVLRTRPWATMSWKKLAEAIADREGDAGPDLDSYLAALVAWVDGARALHPVMLTRVGALAAELAGDRVAVDAHGAKALLYLHGRGRLALADIEARCPSPAATLALAATLGVDTGRVPPMPA